MTNFTFYSFDEAGVVINCDAEEHTTPTDCTAAALRLLQQDPAAQLVIIYDGGEKVGRVEGGVLYM